MSGSWSSKKECRSFFKSLCASQFAQGLVQNQQQLDLHIRDFLKSQSGVWGAYRGLPEEAKVEDVKNISHLSWVFPRMREGHLDFFEARDFALGPYGVWEPSQDSPQKDITSIDGLLIPGLVFNKNGNRLGKGKGFYDKTLASYQGVKVGICFDFQVSEDRLPTEAHDIVMDYIITETGLIDCSKHR
ncbi:5-formyltetrahydrofolate cyclo-ligase [Bdellovibrio reynosensis]|uniref:5-formyltetrahydrofolate cyclo-ligase n=1 Tax=Bdellovibrio reynosensis TaxID=2835041 RepID=A0ABY4CFX7_9BACT|nr:5-formyltetrahydrofolate cyclo-ligase [Bdellovibrio reynosensis]UOF02696.1 5-formyltetrahydrofolate cyclo-ligase [Bdellovibrio reynosensis]